MPIRKVDLYFAGQCLNGTGGPISYSWALFVADDMVCTWSDFDLRDPRNSTLVASIGSIGNALCYLIGQGMTNDQVRFYGSDIEAVNLMNGRWRARDEKGNVAKAALELRRKFRDLHFTFVMPKNNILPLDLCEKEFREHGIEVARKG